MVDCDHARRPGAYASWGENSAHAVRRFARACAQGAVVVITDVDHGGVSAASIFMAINWPSQCRCLGGSVTPTCQPRLYLASEAGLSNLAPASVSLIVASPSSLIRAMYPMWEPFVVTSKLYGWVIRGTGPLHLG